MGKILVKNLPVWGLVSEENLFAIVMVVKLERSHKGVDVNRLDLAYSWFPFAKSQVTTAIVC